MVIETSAEWWREIEQNWDELRPLLDHPSASPAGVDELERLKTCRDPRIARRLQAVRRAMRGRARRQRGWRVLADLCAEQWVLYAAA